jgi:hypothetical protein
MYTYENGQFGGFARAVLDAFAADQGHEFIYRALPVNRLFRDFIEGQLDFKYPDNPLWSADLKKNKGVTYSDPVVRYIDGIMVTPENVGKGVQSIHSLGTVLGFTAWEWEDAIRQGKVMRSESRSFEGALQQAILGRVDGLYADLAVVNYHMERIGKSGSLVYDPSLPHTDSFYYLSTLRHGKIIAEFNAWMHQRASLVQSLREKFAVELHGIK